MKIRPATKREVGKFFRAVNRSHMRSETVLLSASRLALADEFFVAIVNRKIVGAVCLVLLTEYVLKAYHGRGIGTRLTRTGIERLISLGRTPIFVDVAGKGMDRTLDKLPARLRRHLRLERAYLKYGEVELPER
jgi:GNAT superfamily N-acetyltransferase